jgi:hypothetical protein
MKRLTQLTLAVVLSLTLITPVLSTPEAAPLLQDTAAQIVLQAPSTARVGELVRLDASESSADSFKWLLVPESVDFEVYAEGQKAVFSARVPGEYLFIVAVAKEGSVDVVTWLLRVIGPPEPPNENSNITDHVVYWLWNLQVSDESKIALADNFDRIANMDLGEPKEWIYETSRSNRDVLGDEYAVWKPFLQKVGAKLEKMAEYQQLTTPEEHAIVWRQIAEGLRKG